MPDININGIIVNFPVEPYEVQKIYMSKVLDCLQNKKHGVLESPTGTGKTLSLLCSSLSWLTTKKAQIQAEAVSGAIKSPGFREKFFDTLKNDLRNSVGNDVGSNNNTLLNWAMPKIIYASRTHSQLSQAMQEYKRTTYKHLKVSVIGSRDQLCIHPEVSKEQNSADKMYHCQLKIRSKSCLYFNNIELRKTDPMFKDSICDIEDLVKAGKKMKCCPYFMAKELMQNADITFMPYNYLLDPKTRKSQGIDLQNHVILIDEAHNIEKTCEDAASIEFSSTDIALCIDEITSVMKHIADEVSSSENGGLSFDNGFNNEAQKDFTAEDLCILKSMFLLIEKAVDEISLEKTDGQTFPGHYIFQLLEKAELTQGKVIPITDKVDKIVLWLSTLSTSPFARSGKALQKFCDFLRIIFSSNSNILKHQNEVKECYKVFISFENGSKNQRSHGWDSKKLTKRSNGKIINYWCFSPGLGMRQLTDLGVHSIILTSGTLSPLKPFISELGIPIDVELENSHIIQSTQVCVGILNQGPDGHQLNCSYNTRNDPKYISSLGRTVYNFSCIIPDGLLIFFPSYSIMKKFRDDWQHSGLWSTITQNKPIFVEPQSKEGFNNVINEFYEKIRDPYSRGAIFLGVCRGKVSEGLDFANGNGRAVLIIGLPYPPMMDPRVMLKQKYLDEIRAKDKNGLAGNQWYQLEASRAVNQAVGRVIRHKKDFGAIILCDCRFNNVAFKNHLSSWLRPHIKNFSNFGKATKELSDFFKNVTANFPHVTKPTDQHLSSIDYDDQSNGFKGAVKTLEMQSPKELRQRFDFQDNVDLSSYKLSLNTSQIHEKANFSQVNIVAGSNKSTINFVTSKIQGNWSKTIENNSCQVTKEDSSERPTKKRKLKIQPTDTHYHRENSTDYEENNLSSIEANVGNSSMVNNSVKNCEDDTDSNKKKVGETYLKAVKKSLTKENFVIFAKMIDTYKKKRDFNKLMETLEKLFLINSDVKHLFLGFKTFVKKQDLNQFDEYIKNLKLND